MGTTPKPLTLVVDPALCKLVEFQGLAAQGHRIIPMDEIKVLVPGKQGLETVTLAEVDGILGVNAQWFISARVKDLDRVLAAGRARRYHRAVGHSKERDPQ